MYQHKPTKYVALNRVDSDELKRYFTKSENLKKKIIV